MLYRICLLPKFKILFITLLAATMTTMDMRIARTEDTDKVSSILQEAARWLEHKGTPLWQADELLPNKIRAEVASAQFWLAEVDGSIAGCVRYQTEDRLFWPDVPPGESAFIHRLVVRRAFAGGRISSAIINWAKHRAHSQGKSFLRLDCEARTEKLCKVYEAAGFRKRDERQVGPYLVARFEFDLAANKAIQADAFGAADF